MRELPEGLCHDPTQRSDFHSIDLGRRFDRQTALTKVGGAGASMIQRVTTTLFGARVTLTAALSTSAALPIVLSCTNARC